MLLTERVTIYDVLARNIASAGFHKYKRILTAKDSIDLRATFRYYYEFPVKGIKDNNVYVTLDELLDSRVLFRIQYDNEPTRPGIVYFFYVHYYKDTKFIGTDTLHKENPDITIILYLFDDDPINFKTNFDWQKFYFQLLQAVRHELEHQAQYLRSEGVPLHHFDFYKDEKMREDEEYLSQVNKDFVKDIIGKTPKNQALYATILASEVEAELKSFYLVYRKTKKKSMYNLLVPTLIDFGLDTNDINYVIGEWEKYRKKYFKYMPSLWH